LDKFSTPQQYRLAENMDDPKWIASTQKAAELYDAGEKIWHRQTLLDIERQLTESRTLKKFIVPCLDGSLISIPNPTYGHNKPIW